MSSDEEDTWDKWDKELEALMQGTDEKDWHCVGWLRNGLGLHSADVFSINRPVEWLPAFLLGPGGLQS